jgi:NitT/TauT family transport system substrate-binding protein
MRRKTMSASFATALIAVASSSAFADTGEIKAGYQNGLTYFPIILMEANHTFEKHAAKLGIKDFQCGSVGASSVPLLYVKSHAGFKMVSSLSYMPLFLNSSNPAIHTIKDYKGTTNNWIGDPTQGTSVQAISFQMGVAKAFGIENAKSLDYMTHTIAHPDAMAQMLSGKAEVNNHFTAPPFQYQELREGKGKVHKVYSSYDAIGKSTFVTEMCSVEFEKENPKTIQAFTEAIAEEINWINAHKTEAAKRYIELSGTKETQESVLSQLNDPDIEFNVVHKGIEKYSQFMKAVGTLKVDKAPTAKEMSFKNLYNTAAN